MVVHPLWRPYVVGSNAARQAERVDFRQTEPGPLQEHDPRWADGFRTVRAAVEAALGPDVRLTHVGSTVIPDVVAKPVIDADLLVPDVLHEETYLPQLEAQGFRLLFRDELGGDPHRQLAFAEPNANLHVWAPDAVEPRRHRVFVDWLRTHPEDRRAYAAAKRIAAEPGATVRYNDAKAAAVYDVYERVFAADPAHEHTPQPRG